MLTITLVKSLNRAKRAQVDTVHALGLKKIGQSVQQQDNPAIRGMLHKVAHLVTFQDEQSR